MMEKMFAKVRIFLEDIKFEHSLFALPFAYLGLMMAERGMPSGRLWLWITVAMVSFRTMAMGVNRLIDAPVDAENPRTQGRALPSGRLRHSFVGALAGLSLAIFGFSAYRLGTLCLLLAPVPVVLAWVYPFTKRISWLSHFVLGSVLAIAPYGAWIASRGTLGMVPLCLSIGVCFWVAGFDMIYALQDVACDRAHGLHSFPARFGQGMTLVAVKVLHMLSAIAWAVAGYLNQNGAVYFAGILLAALFLNRAYRLVRSFGVAKINEAFFVMNAIVSVGVFATAAIDMMLKGAGS